MLIVVRALLGAAGATLAPSTLALISNMFPDPGHRGRAVSLWATGQFAGGAFGPVLAGLLLQHFWWGSVFLVAAPAMALVAIAGPVLLPEYRGERAGRLDPASVALSLVAVLSLVYGIKQLTLADSLLAPALALLVGAVVGALFVRRQLRLATPLLDLRLLRNAPLTAVIVGLLLAGVAMAGTGLLVTQYLQGVLGFSPAAAAVLCAPMGIGCAVGTMAAPALTRRRPKPVAIAAGLAVSALGSLLLVGAHGAAALPLVLVGTAVLGVGTGPLFALGTGLVLGSVPPARAGSAASMSETANYLGGSLGVALLGVLAAVVYQRGTGGRSDSLADALAAPAARAAVPLDAARAAFTDSVHVTAAVAAVLFAALAVLVLVLRTARRPARRTDPEPSRPAQAPAGP
jgi:DHA2 family multidrug resistance protein-like MFS transporter